MVYERSLIVSPEKKQLERGDFIVDEKVLILAIEKKFYKGCEVCGKAYKTKNVGDVVECSSKPCRGEQRKVERISFIKAIGCLPNEPVTIIVPYYKISSFEGIKELDEILLSGFVEERELIKEINQIGPRIYALNIKKNNDISDSFKIKSSSNKLFKCKTCGCGPWRNPKFAKEHIQARLGHEIEEVNEVKA